MPDGKKRAGGSPASAGEQLERLERENKLLKAEIARHHEVQETLASERDKLRSLVDGLGRTEVGIDIIGIDHQVHFQNRVLEERFGALDGTPCYVKYMGGAAPCPDCPMTSAVSLNRLESREMVGQDGRDYRVLSAPYANPDGTVDKVIEVIIDVTERRQTDRMLQESEMMFRSLVENSHSGIFIVADDFKFAYANEMFCTILGYAHDEVIGRDFRSVLDGESRSLVAERYVKRQRGEAVPSRYEFNVIRKDGQKRRVEISSTVVLDSAGRPRTLAQVLDVTERKKAEEELQEAHAELEGRVEQRTAELQKANDLLLQEMRQREVAEEKRRESETKYRDLVENANSIILELDTRGRVTFMNAFGQEFFGFAEPEIIGRSVLGTIVPKTDSRGTNLRSKIMELVRHPEKFHNSENENIRRNGEKVWIAWTNKGLYDQKGRLKEVLCIGIDRTEQKRTAEMLAQQEQEKAAMAERQRLARDLHDAVTQTLFSASLVAAALPKVWAKDAVEGQRCLEELRQLTRGALAEMRMLLVELRPTALTEAGLADLLRQLTEAASARAGFSVAYQVDGKCTVPPDVQVALYRVAQEALNNVLKHSGASEAAVSLECRADSVRLGISDNGAGFDVEAVSPKHLGLRIMQERAAGVGAIVKVTSTEGHGTEVTVAWPDASRREGA